MGQPNIPRKDSSAAFWMRNFARQLEEYPQTYYVSPEEVAEVAAAVTAFRDALAVVLQPSLKTQITVMTKNDRRREAENVCRRLYVSIKRDPRISNADKVNAGIRPAKTFRSRSTAPQVAPDLQIIPRQGGYRINWRGPSTRGTAKPAGCAMLQLFVLTGDGQAGPGVENAPGHVVCEEGRLVNVYTSTGVLLPQSELVDHRQRLNVVRTATFAARWAGPKGQPGPWSRTATVRLAA